MSKQDAKPNNLINEKSPYLLQHAYNPVKWYAWNSEAFTKAKNENKPIFLSIGYSTCHWCHVMEHESFEDDQVAELMNKNFVSIKVDREERPDIDHIYMNVCQMLTGTGGWPLTIIMTPDKKPFFAGTYFPKDSAANRIGMLDLVNKVKQVWDTERENIYNSAEQITAELQKPLVMKSGEIINSGTVKKSYHELASRFDEKNGGFGSRPKFPTPHNLIFLMRYFDAHGSDEAMEMVNKTLLEMRKGGLYDHIGFGFHRYSTDPEWLLPHFEKMLYDQAMLMRAYTEAYQITGNDLYKQTAEEIAEYVKRDLTSENGAFYSAEDADSEGEEGKFYVWNINEFRETAIGDAEILADYFNLSESGNFKDEATGKSMKTNILHIKKELNDVAEKYGISAETLKEKIEAGRKKLFEKRENRIRPHLDDKILTDWNGLMIASLAYSGRVLKNDEMLNAAVKAAEFIKNNMYSGGRLLHRYRDGDAAIDGMLDDYTFMAWAYIELYQATFETKYLKDAIYLQNALDQYFWDDEFTGFFMTTQSNEKLIARMKDIFDSAIPSGNSISLQNLNLLWKITGDQQYVNKARKMLESFSTKIGETPSAFTAFLTGYLVESGEAPEIVIAADKNNVTANEMVNFVNENYMPNTVLVLKTNENNISEIIHFTENMNYDENQAKAYICRHFACEKPVDNINEFKAILDIR